jgi:hypothetical protein
MAWHGIYSELFDSTDEMSTDHYYIWMYIILISMENYKRHVEYGGTSKSKNSTAVGVSLTCCQRCSIENMIRTSLACRSRASRQERHCQAPDLPLFTLFSFSCPPPRLSYSRLAGPSVQAVDTETSVRDLPLPCGFH